MKIILFRKNSFNPAVWEELYRGDVDDPEGGMENRYISPVVFNNPGVINIIEERFGGNRKTQKYLLLYRYPDKYVKKNENNRIFKCYHLNVTKTESGTFEAELGQ